MSNIFKLRQHRLLVWFLSPHSHLSSSTCSFTRRSVLSCSPCVIVVVIVFHLLRCMSLCLLSTLSTPPTTHRGQPSSRLCLPNKLRLRPICIKSAASIMKPQPLVLLYITPHPFSSVLTDSVSESPIFFSDDRWQTAHRTGLTCGLAASID